MENEEQKCRLCDSEVFYVELSSAPNIALRAANFGYIAMWASGDLDTPYYFPKFCPECGRELRDEQER